MKKIPTTVTVSRQFKTSAGEQPLTSEDETLEVHEFVTEPARVGLEYGLTLNLGNYESARIAVSVSIPCYKEEMEGAYDAAARWVESKIAQEVQDIRQKSGSSPF